MTESTKTMIKALNVLSQEIKSGDGVANACIAEAALMIEQLSQESTELIAKAIEDAADHLQPKSVGLTQLNFGYKNALSDLRHYADKLCGDTV